MAVLKPRERLVYFRISEDEFRQFVSVCEQAGARSVSDLARNAVQRLIADGQRQREDEELDNKIRILEGLIEAVTEQLHFLAMKQGPGGTAVTPANGLGGLTTDSLALDQNGRRNE